MNTSPNKIQIRTLIVEDSETDAELMVRELQRAGLEIESIRVDTASALQGALGNQTWDVVLSDSQMPGFSGKAALAIVKAAAPDLPFILVSGTVGEEAAVAALHAGADDYLIKGRLARLGPAVSRVLQAAEHQRARRTSEERFRDIAETAGDWIWEVDARGLYTFASPAVERILGYTPDEIIGRKHFYDLFSPDIRAEVKEAAFARFVAKQTIRNLVNSNLHKDGRIVILETTAVPVLDKGGLLLGYRGADTDITERRRVEEKLKAQTELLNKATDAIYTRKLDGVVTYWNKSAERLYGWTQAEAVGRKITDLNLKEVDANAELHSTLIEDGSWMGERQQVNKTGQKLDVLVRLTVMAEENGGPMSIFAIVTDITEKKKLAEQLLRAQRLESIGMLSAGIAHDINNVLAPIGMAASLLRRHLSESADLRLLEILEKCSERGAGLVRQILGFSRGIGGKPQLVQMETLAPRCGQSHHRDFSQVHRRR